ncbi:MAG: glutathione S-transferase family protein [Pseudorhodoplanes sp.]|nr:glutathione S-transferase family protein [Pseudorhodoplanes sp.]
MSLTLYFHPLSSFCMKVLIALYENDTPFTPHVVDLMDQTAAANLKKMWPIGKFPVMRDDARNQTIPETSIIIEYLDQHFPGQTRFIPADRTLALQSRLQDRFYDLYVQLPMQGIVGDRLRPAEKKDPFGVTQAKERLAGVYEMIERDMAQKTWAIGDDFTIADCAAAPALFYANKVLPLEGHKNVVAYLERLTQRPSYARALKEAEPYFRFFPKE